MKLGRIFTISLSFLLLGFSSYQNIFMKTTNKKTLDTNVIVSLKDSDIYDKKEVQNIFFNELIEKDSFNFRKIDVIDALNNYVVLKINKDDLKLINSFDVVSYAYKEINYETTSFSPLDPTYSQYLSDSKILDTNYSEIEMNKGNEVKDGENTFIAIIDSSFDYNHETFSSLFSSYIRFNKSDIDNKVKNDSFNGKNYKYINNKVIFSYDYSSNDDDVRSEVEHGTHVASTASGNGTYKGIAPSSQLALMKVFGDKVTMTSSSTYLKALEDAYLLDVDAINMSLGSALISSKTASDLAVDEVLERLNEEGINVYVAASNDGRDVYTGSDYEYTTIDSTESGILGHLAMSENVTTVASSTLSDSETDIYALIDNKRSILLVDKIVNSVSLTDNVYKKNIFEKEYKFYDLIKNKESYEYVIIPNKGYLSDYEGIDVNNKIVVVERGDLLFSIKIYNAVIKGAKGLIITNTKGEKSNLGFSYVISDEDYEKYSYIPIVYEDGVRYLDTSKITIPVALTSYESGEVLKNATNKSFTLYQDKMSYFSSTGANADLTLKPDLSAPGTNIYGAYNTYNDSTKTSTSLNKYYFNSGTSMAAPNLTGAYSALLSSYNLNESNRHEISKIIKYKMNSSTTLLQDEYNTDITPRRMGNGLVNIDNAFKASSYLLYNNKSKIELYNNEDISKGNIKFDVSLFEEINNKSYKVSLTVMAPRIVKDKIKNNNGEMVETSLINSNDILLENYDLGEINASYGENIISVNKTISTESKSYLEEFINGTYLEGYLTLKSEENELHIPYLGFYGDYDKAQPFEDFSFLKDDNKVYESDLFNRHFNDNMKINNAHYESQIYIGDDETYYKRNVLTNNFDFTSIYKTMDYSYEDDNLYHFYTGEIDGSLNKGITIQLFMKRSVISNRVYLKDSNDNIVTSSDSHFYNNFVDSYSLGLYGDGTELCRSYILYGNNLSSHRAYYYLPLVNESRLNEELFESGIYYLEMNFTLGDGSIYTYKIAIHINEEYKRIVKIYDVSLKDNILRIYIKGESLKEILINNKNIDLSLLTSLSNDKYVLTLSINEYDSNLFISITNNEDNTINLKYFIEEKAFISGNNITTNYSIKKIESDRTYFNISIYKDLNQETLYDENNELYIGVYSDNILNSVYENKGNNQTKIDYKNEDNNDLITFKSNSSSFIIYKNVENEDIKFIISKLKSLIIVVSTILVLVIFIAVTSLIIKIHKNKKV